MTLQLAPGNGRHLTLPPPCLWGVHSESSHFLDVALRREGVSETNRRLHVVTEPRRGLCVNFCASKRQRRDLLALGRPRHTSYVSSHACQGCHLPIRRGLPVVPPCPLHTGPISNFTEVTPEAENQREHSIISRLKDSMKGEVEFLG